MKYSTPLDMLAPRRCLAVALLFLICFNWGTATAENALLPNGNFETATQKADWPDGWTNEAEGLITWENEEGSHFVRLVSQAPDQLVAISQVLPVPTGPKGLVFHARFRTSNVKFGKSFVCDARARLQFIDASGAALKDAGDQVFDSHAKTWTDVSRKFLVPAGAAQLKVTLCINRAASGTLDVQEVGLAPMDEAEAAAMAMGPLLAEKKKAEDQAEVQSMLQLPPKTAGLRVSGPKLVTSAGTQVLLRGVNVCSLEWSAKGEHIHRSMKVALKDWKANVVRLPVHNDFWFGRGKGKEKSNDADAYRKIVDDVIQMAAGQGAYVILDLHRFHAPGEYAVEFWSDAALRYKDNPAVLFDIFNEPTGIPWEVWRNGGEVTEKKKDSPEPVKFQSPGMQGLVDAVRKTGAKNVIVAGGLGFAYDLSGVLEGYALDDKGGNGIMYATHFYNWHKGWEKRFLSLADKYPLLVGEFGADIKKMSFIPAKNQEDPYTWVPDALAMVQKYQLNWTAFCMHPAATPVLIKDWNYTPTPFWGEFVKDALAGKRFELKKLR